MTGDLAPLGFWRTVGLLLGAARKRSRGRRERQQKLIRQRSGKSTDWTGIGFPLTIVFMVVLNVMAAFVLRNAVAAAERIQSEHRGKIVVSRFFLNAVREMISDDPGSQAYRDDASDYFSSEARRIADENGGDKKQIERDLRRSVWSHGTRDFVASNDVVLGLSALARSGRLTAMIGSLVLLWWGIMLVCQGEGLELDLQRRRHPMWEWLFSHPVRAGPVFLAEMLSPIAANPIYWGGPFFVGVVYGFVYGPELGLVAGPLIGLPLIVAAASLGKALEIGITLRFPPRSRGAMIGIMSWLGYASLMLFFLGLYITPKIVAVLAKFLAALTAIPWPWLGLFLGARSDGSFSFPQGVLSCWIFAVILTAGGIAFSVWGANRGLSGNFAESNLPRVRKGNARFGREPLYRKEFLWFVRDRSAIVQTILIPITVAGFQVFNLRGLLNQAQGAWNYLCGVGILFGTYFLWVLGPKSLTSEGSALWIPLTWPRGLESLLKAKAWLWSLLSSAMVGLVLCYAAVLYPREIWKIAIVGTAWFFFGRSMAEKTVTLVTVTSESGETQRIPQGRRWAAQLGMLTFAIGVFTQQWHIAFMGIVYSYITAAAMWQNFRARLPYLYDPWSEQMPAPPTLMHAMVAISIMVEAGAVITGIVLAAAGRENLAVAQAVSYGICAVAVSVGMWNFLSNRGVSNRDVWRWESAEQDAGQARRWRMGDRTKAKNFFLVLAVGAVAGLALGLFAHAYLAVLTHIPQTAELIRKSQAQLAKIPNLRLSYSVMAVFFAPFAEEYLFRGLLFRALDREWGGWRAVVGSAAFFVIYHPPLSWLPVFLLGACNAILFKKTGRLAPAVILHMVYNAIVLT